MTLIPKFLLKQIVEVINISINFDGSKKDGTKTAHKCRVERYSEKQFNVGGDETEYSYVVYIPGDVDVKEDDKLVYETITYTIKKIDKHYWIDNKVDHTKLYLI